MLEADEMLEEYVCSHLGFGWAVGTVLGRLKKVLLFCWEFFWYFRSCRRVRASNTAWYIVIQVESDETNRVLGELEEFPFFKFYLNFFD